MTLPNYSTCLGEVSRFVEHVVMVASHPLSAEHGRKAEAGRHLILADTLVVPFAFPDHKLAKLHAHDQWQRQKGAGESKILTWISVSVIVDRLTRAYPVRFKPLKRMYSHQRSQSLASMSCIPLFSPTYVL